MKKSKVAETKYRGYIIKPAVTGFRIYRKEFYIGEYATRQIAMHRIDQVVAKRSAMLPPKEPPSGGDKSDSGQMTLFKDE